MIGVNPEIACWAENDGFQKNAIMCSKLVIDS